LLDRASPHVYVGEPAYWLYAGAVGVIEDYRDYRKLTQPLTT
jgi:hypothetical protein